MLSIKEHHTALTFFICLIAWQMLISLLSLDPFLRSTLSIHFQLLHVPQVLQADRSPHLCSNSFWWQNHFRIKCWHPLSPRFLVPQPNLFPWLFLIFLPTLSYIPSSNKAWENVITNIYFCPSYYIQAPWRWRSVPLTYVSPSQGYNLHISFSMHHR